MTFIASVLSREGVAVIADSLVTTPHNVICQDDLFRLFRSKNNDGQSDPTFSAEEIMGLFRTKPSHTKNYENKLFRYDNYTAITTSGMAWLDGMKIEQVIKEIVRKNEKNKKSYKSKNITTKVVELCDFLTIKVKEHIEQSGSVGSVNFILSHYNKSENKSYIFRINILPSQKKDLSDPDHKFISYEKVGDYESVVSDGQNGITEKILWGELLTAYSMVPKVCKRIFDDFDINNIPDGYVEGLTTHEDIITENLMDGVNVVKLSQLSLQQAVDLACLLMNIEIDFQKYTKNIPTVGGVVKLAIIDEGGFRFIAGNEITKPVNI